MATVLIVDDERLIGYLLSEALADEGHHPLVALNGFEGIHYINSGCPHLVISDHMMPGMDGMALLEALRGHPMCHEVPFILMSGMGPPSLKKPGISYSAFVKKPFVLSEVVSLISGMVTHKDLNL